MFDGVSDEERKSLIKKVGRETPSRDVIAYSILRPTASSNLKSQTTKRERRYGPSIWRRPVQCTRAKRSPRQTLHSSWVTISSPSYLTARHVVVCIGREKPFSCKLVDQRPKGFHDWQAEDERQHYACHKARRCPRSEFIFSAVVAISLITVLHSSQRRRRLSYRYLFVVGYSIYVVIIILCCYWFVLAVWSQTLMEVMYWGGHYKTWRYNEGTKIKEINPGLT